MLESLSLLGTIFCPPLGRLIFSATRSPTFRILPEEPCVPVSGREKAVWGRQAEGHLRGWAASIRVLATDAEAGIVGHAAKLRAMIGRCDGWMGL